MKNTKNANKGFTIIEVLIVLAIAGLILLVVFLAVPALQRNSRNTQRKSDVSNVLGAVGDYVANNGGKLPATTTAAVTPAGSTVAYPAGSFGGAFVGSIPKLGFYAEPVQVSWTKRAAAATVTAPTGNDTVMVVNFLKCDGNTQTTAGASSRSVVALFNIEGSNGDVAQCQET